MLKIKHLFFGGIGIVIYICYTKLKQRIMNLLEQAANGKQIHNFLNGPEYSYELESGLEDDNYIITLSRGPEIYAFDVYVDENTDQGGSVTSHMGSDLVDPDTTELTIKGLNKIMTIEGDEIKVDRFSEELVTKLLDYKFSDILTERYA